MWPGWSLRRVHREQNVGHYSGELRHPALNEARLFTFQDLTDVAPAN
jgi:hypothetical protein